jgi:hypothetical protein
MPDAVGKLVDPVVLLNSSRALDLTASAFVAVLSVILVAVAALPVVF